MPSMVVVVLRGQRTVQRAPKMNQLRSRCRRVLTRDPRFAVSLQIKQWISRTRRIWENSARLTFAARLNLEGSLVMLLLASFLAAHHVQADLIIPARIQPIDNHSRFCSFPCCSGRGERID